MFHHLALLVQLGAATLGDLVHAPVLLLVGANLTEFLKVLQGRIDGARARRVHAARAFLNMLDDLVAVARAFAQHAENYIAQRAAQQSASAAPGWAAVFPEAAEAPRSARSAGSTWATAPASSTPHAEEAVHVSMAVTVTVAVRMLVAGPAVPPWV